MAWGRVWQTIREARWGYFVASGALAIGSYLLRGLRWRILLNAEADLGVGTVFWANMAGYLGNNFLPARAGEIIRTLLISSRSGLSKTYVLTTALSERLVDVIALVLAGSLVLLGVNPKPRWMAGLSGTMAVIAGAAALAILVLPRSGHLLEGLLRRLPMPGRIRAGLLGLAGEFLLGLRAFHDWGRLAGFALLTALVWSMDAVTVMIGGLGLALHISFRVAILLLTGMGLGSALPSTPGYVGVYQFVAVTVLVPFGIGRDSALAYILVAQAVSYLVVMILGLPGWYLSRPSIFGKRMEDIL